METQAEVNPLANVIKVLSKLRGVTEADAVVGFGAAIKITDTLTMTPEDVISLCEARAQGNLATLSEAEKTMLFALKYIKRKNVPYRRETAKVSRNADCPCGSGKKFKFCCLDFTTVNNWEHVAHEQ